MERRQLVALYRVQLRLAKLFDSRPRLKNLLKFPLVAPRAGGSHENAVATTVADWQRSFLGGTHYWYKPPRSLSAFVSEGWRTGAGAPAALAAVLVDAAYNAELAMVRIAAADEDVAARADHALPDMSPPIGALQECDVVRPGCLLVENAAATRPGRSVVFVYDVSRVLPPDEGGEGRAVSSDSSSDSGSSGWALRGFTVNRPYPSTVAAVSGLGSALGNLGSLTLFHGGFSGDGISVVHCWSDVAGAVPVNEEETLFLGGDLDALNARLAEGGAAAASSVRVFMGYFELPLVEKPSVPVDDAGSLQPPDLQLEDPDRFLSASGPGVRDLLFTSPMFDTTGPFRDGTGLGVHDRVEGYNHARFYHQNIAWAAAVKGLAVAAAQAEGVSGEGGQTGLRRSLEVADSSALHAAAAHYAEAALPVVVRSFADPSGSGSEVERLP